MCTSQPVANTFADTPYTTNTQHQHELNEKWACVPQANLRIRIPVVRCSRLRHNARSHRKPKDSCRNSCIQISQCSCPSAHLHASPSGCFRNESEDQRRPTNLPLSMYIVHPGIELHDHNHWHHGAAMLYGCPYARAHVASTPLHNNCKLQTSVQKGPEQKTEPVAP